MGIERYLSAQWREGEPNKARWCLANYLTNDEPPAKGVTMLWFNPDAEPKRRKMKNKTIQEIVRKFKNWKKGKDYDHICDEIFNFAESELTRGELLELLEFADLAQTFLLTHQDVRNKGS